MLPTMETHRYFGLSAAPFEGPPDPRFFHRATGHAETLATLEYAVHAGKACTLALGESGSGKTLLARLLAGSVAARSDVLWVHGLDQPGEVLVASICRGDGLGPLGMLGARNASEVPLTQCLPAAASLRASRPARRRTVVIVDDADGLRPARWEELLALVARQSRVPLPVTTVLFGLPSLLETLAAPQFVRLHRRLFRICHLDPLTDQDSAAYVRHRLAIAGGKSEIFTTAALALVCRIAAGNPALLNQLCDNAMVEAFGDDQRCVDAPHVIAAWHSMQGEPEPSQPVRMPPQTAVGLAPGVAPPHAGSRAARRARQHRGRSGDHSFFDKPPVLAKFETIAAGIRSAAIEPLNERLHTLESRLSEAFDRVQEARQRPQAEDTPAASAPESTPS